MIWPADYFWVHEVEEITKGTRYSANTFLCRNPYDMPKEIIDEAKNNFKERLQVTNWDIHHNDLPFNPSALSLFKWAPIADDLKTLDRKIVLNSVILKWDVVKKEFKERVKF